MLRFGSCLVTSILLIAMSPPPATAGGNHSFSVVLWETPAEEQEFYYGVPGSAHLEPIEVLEMQRSPAQSLPSKYKQVTIYSKGEEGKKELATIDLDPTFDSSLISLKPEDDGSYKAIVLEDHPGSPPYGTYLFYNCSELDIEGKLGEADLKLPAGAMAPVDPKVQPKAELAFELWHMLEENKKFLQRNTFSYNPNKYLIVFLYTEASPSGRIQLKSKGLTSLKGAK